MPKCIKCDKSIPKGSKFCNHCGTKQKNATLYRRKDGLYEKVLTIDGKRVAFRGHSETEVFEKILSYQSIQKDKEKGELFEIVAENWYWDNESEWAISTQHSYRSKKQRAVDYFEGERITEITSKDVSRYVNRFPISWSQKTATGYLAVLKEIFKYALINEYISSDPCAFVLVPKGRVKKRRRSVTEGERKIINNSTNIEGGMFMYFLMYSGLRRGEAAALTWGDIDFKNKLINVNKSVTWDNNKPVLKTPKTEAGIRKVVLLDCLAEKLKPLRRKKNDLVFHYQDKLYHNSYLTRMIKRWQNATELEDVTPHVVRHGFATLCFNADLAPKDVQDMLGHAQYSTTMDIYTDVQKERKEAARATLNDYIKTKMTQKAS